MTMVIKFNHFRKNINRAQKNTLAAHNRARRGRRKDDCRRNEMVEERSTRDLDGCRLESDGLDDNELTWDGFGLK